MANPILTIQADQIVLEGDSATKDVLVTVSLNAASTETVTVNYSIDNSGGAQSGEDYVIVSSTPGLLTFAPEATSQTITVQIKGDTIGEEEEESFVISLENPVNAGFQDGAIPRTEITIQDDDPIIDVSIADPPAPILEGNSGHSSSLVFTVSLTNDNPLRTENITVNYSTREGVGVDGANAGMDYTAQQGTLTFPPNESSKLISIPVLGDNSKENNESFTVELSSPSRGAIVQGVSATGTITDDDTQVIPPVMSIGNVTLVEGNDGSQIANFTVSLSDKSIESITVSYTTANSVSGNTAIASIDYIPMSGTITFAPGETTKAIPVTIIGDAFAEFDETFLVILSNPQQAVFPPGVSTVSAIGTISNDDGAVPQISIKDVSLAEGNNGTTTATFTVSLSASASQAITVNYATADNTAIAGSDYISNSGTLTFNPGQSSLPLTVDLIGDTVVEPNELFVVNLSGAVNGAIADSQAIGTVINDDSPVILPPEDLKIMGTSANDFLTGGGGNDTIEGLGGRDSLFGESGDDTLVGGTKNDILKGGLGNDNFVFDTGRRFKQRQIGVDQIIDFTQNGDKIVLDRTTFNSLRRLTFASVRTIAQAEKSSAQITYVRGTGSLYFNQNGRADGFGSGGQFADLTNGLRLSVVDFAIIA